MRPFTLLVIAVLLTVSQACLAEGTSPALPCPYSGELLKAPNGKLVRYSSDEMKARATHKVDVTGVIKQADIDGTAVLDVLVDMKGAVVCIKSKPGHPMVRGAVEEALRLWTFKPAERNGKAMAYVGRLRFRLCHCGTAGITIVN